MDGHDLTDHLPAELAVGLAAVHRNSVPGDRIRVRLPPPDVLSGRILGDVLEGAGFTVSRRASGKPTWLTRVWTLPDTVGPDMTVLVAGLNPSPAAADAGIGFARPGNRFWPAAIEAGLVSIDRDPDHALAHHGVGMTDLVKRTTRRAAELDRSEYATGLARLDRLVRLHGPDVVCFVGLAGWRAARDRHAVTGWQPEGLGTAAVYVMPSTSGLNASSTPLDFIRHFEAVRAGT